MYTPQEGQHQLECVCRSFLGILKPGYPIKDENKINVLL